MSVAFQHRELSVREEIHSRFAKFLKIMEEVFMFSTWYLRGQVFRGFMFTMGDVPCPPQLVADGASEQKLLSSFSLPLSLVFIQMKI